MSLLAIDNLSLSIGGTPVLQRVDLTLEKGEVLGLVGESGSGKSMTALAVMGLLPSGSQASGRILFEGSDLLRLDEPAMCRLRGDDIGMVFQEPMTALNPVKTIGEQVAEGIRWHRRTSRAEADEAARRMLDRVGLPPSVVSPSRFPHQLSGGQRQRVVIAIACALNPKLLIADEPTTALDVVLQAQVLDLLRGLVAENGMGLLLISHDLAVVATMADRIAILRQGTIVESGETARTLSEQIHPYTRQLALASTHVPSIRVKVPASPIPPGDTRAPLLQVENLTRNYSGARFGLISRAPPLRAVDNVSFSIQPGRSVALVGRSGCGKSTLGRLVLALDRPTSGTIHFMGESVDRSEAELRPARRNMQMVFQDPYGSFDPRQRVETLVAEPLALLSPSPGRGERRDMVTAALAEVGLSPKDMVKYPHEFSGGQRQRLSIARSIITRPKLIVADEAVSALDVSIRAKILDLLADLSHRLGVAYLFITHDLTVARAITDEVLIMDEGKIVEHGPTRTVLDAPKSDAARALVTAAPDLRRALAARIGEQG